MSNIHHSVKKDFSLHVEKRTRTTKNTTQQDTLVLAKYSNIGYYLLTPLLLGVFIGLGLDTYFRSKPLFTLIGISLGFISAAYSLYKLVKDSQET